MDTTNMQKPAFAHSIHYCQCATNSEVINQKWFVWILDRQSPSNVIVFDSLNVAVKYGEDYIYDKSITPLPKDADVQYFRGALLTGADGSKWCVHDMDWDITICDIVHDLAVGTIPTDGFWQILSTCTYQVFVGRGDDLPPNAAPYISEDGYFLRQQSQSQEQQQPVFISPQDFIARHQ